MTDALKRRDVVTALLAGIDKELIVCGLGSPVSDAIARDRLAPSIRAQAGDVKAPAGASAL